MALPPLLSPTLPAQFGIPLEPISPTLPQMFNKSLIVKLKYKAMPKIRKRPRQANTREFSSSEDEAPSTATRPDPLQAPVESISTADAVAPPPFPASRASSITAEEAKPSTPSNPAASVSKTSTPTATKKLPPLYRQHRKSLQYWGEQAKKKKHESDSAISNRQHRLAAVVSMDSIICFIRAFDHEDRADKVAGKPAHPRSWETLVPYLSQMVGYLESVDSDIAGVCYLIRAVLQVHIAQLMIRTKKKSSQPGSSSHDPASLLHRAVSDFSKGLMYLPFEAASQKYNLSWHENKRSEEMLDPEFDECVLPLHVNSTMQDAAAFAFSVTREWAIHERVEYSMESAKQEVSDP